jgi:CHAT domain-containing protein
MRLLLFSLGVLALPWPAQASAPIAPGVAVKPVVLGDPVMAAAGLGDCLPQDRSALAAMTELSSQLEWQAVFLYDRMEESPAGSSGTTVLCQVRLERAQGDASEDLTRRLLLDLVQLEKADDPALPWLVLEAAGLLAEQGQGAATRALLARHADRFQSSQTQLRAEALRQIAQALPAPDAGAGSDAPADAAALASLAAWVLALGDPAGADATIVETRALVWRFLGQHDRGAAAELWPILAVLTAGDGLHLRRYAVLAWREIARTRLQQGDLVEARAALDHAYATAYAPGERRAWPIGTLDLGLGGLDAAINRARGTPLAELFPLQPVPGAGPLVKGSWFTADRQLDFDDTDPARRAAILTLYRDLWEARGMPDVIARPFAPDIPQLAALAFEQAQSLSVDAAEDDAVFSNALRQTDSAQQRANLERFDALRREQDRLLRRYALATNDREAADVLAELSPLSPRLAALEEAAGVLLDGPDTGLPRWAALNPWYLALRQSYAKGKGEDFLLIVPADGDIHVFAQGRREGRDFAWHRLEGGEALIQPLVERLRCQLNDDGCSAAAIRALEAVPVSPLEEAGQLPFDREAAWQLYDWLIRPVEPVLGKGADVFVVAKGAMGTLPLHLLVTARPKHGGDWADYTAMRKAPWLGDRYAFTTLPSFNAFRPNRFKTLRNPNEDMLFAVASPAFSGSDSPDKLRSASLFAPMRDGVLADLSAIRRLKPLPGTRAEYDSLVAALAPPRTKALIGPEASEAAVKASAELQDARIVLMATHGLLPRQNRGGLAESALVLTPPQVATRADDGLLTASEVLALRLRADWVILSACNTAAGAGGGDSLSGLAAAFLRAGALQVLASHWPVYDDVTPMLTTLTLAAARDRPGIGPSRALQRAMIALRQGRADRGGALAGWQAHWSHPSAWAPFTVISNGDEAIINDRFALKRE